MQMGHSVPPVQTATDHGLEPSLSVDVECNQPGDFFGQMRAIFGLQRLRAHERAFANEPMSRLLTMREVIKWATANGAASYVYTLLVAGPFVKHRGQLIGVDMKRLQQDLMARGGMRC